MRSHLQYLRYVLRHKWFVFVECVRFGILWRGLVHDFSKFRPSEWFPYVRYFYGPKGQQHRVENTGSTYQPGSDEDFDRAWLLHQHRNPHHWQYWILVQDDDPTKVLLMDYDYVLEMVADWMGAGRAQGVAGNTPEWYEAYKGRIKLHPGARLLVEMVLSGIV